MNYCELSLFEIEIKNYEYYWPLSGQVQGEIDRLVINHVTKRAQVYEDKKRLSPQAVKHAKNQLRRALGHLSFVLEDYEIEMYYGSSGRYFRYDYKGPRHNIK